MESVPEFIVLSGLQGSGKSYYARMWQAERADDRTRINYDDLRLELFGANWKWNRADEERMKAIAEQRAVEAVEAGKSVIIDNTNLSEKVRNKWMQLGRSLGATVVQHEINTPIEDCIRRDRRRSGGARVGRGVIERMALFYGFIDWDDVDGQFIIVDIDGTVADISQRLHHVKQKCLTCGAEAEKIGTAFGEKSKGYQCSNAVCHKPNISKKNWPAFFADVANDKPIQPIIDLVWDLANKYNVLFVTGRDTSIAKETEDWLDQHFKEQGCDEPFYSHLFMRNNGDSRPDYEIKAEILELLPKKRIVYILEDRDQVVSMYRKAGMTVLQSAKGDF